MIKLLTTSALLCSFIPAAHANLCNDNLDPCGIIFTSIGTIPSLSTANCASHASATYALKNQGSFDVIVDLSLTEIDSLADPTAVSFDGSSTCTNGGRIAASASCNIILDYQPCIAGALDWDLTVSPSSTQRPLVLGLAKTVTPAPLAAAAGTYINLSSNTYPLASMSMTGGGTWAPAVNSSTPSLPSDFSPAGGGGFFNGVSCSGQFCAAGGAYWSTTNQFPLLAMITGATWSYAIDSSTPTLPSDYPSTNAFGAFASASCSGSNCIAGGTYYNDVTQFPLLANTTDGTDWSYVIDSTTPTLPSDYLLISGFGNIASVSCSGDACIAGGGYYSATNQFPLLATSSDGGASWSYTISSSSPALPSDYALTNAFGSFAGVSCSGDACIAGGSYYTGSNTYALLATSADGGATWGYTVSSSTPALPSGYDAYSTFLSVSCSNDVCIAGGQYTGALGVFYPLLALSTNGGSTWSYVIDSSSGLPANYADYGTFTAVNCSGELCTASGNYYDGTNFYPLLAVSIDAGSTWAYEVDSTPATLPSDFGNNGSLGSVSAGTNVKNRH